MIFGFELGWANIIAGGFFVFALFVFEMLVGLRVIRFKGRTHMKVHKRFAFALIAVAGFHGVLALIVYNGWEIF